MKIIGGTWSPNIIWCLSETPRRFSELKDDITGISPKVLTARLRKLEADGVVQEIPGYGKTVEPVIKDRLVDGVWPQFLNPYL